MKNKGLALGLTLSMLVCPLSFSEDRQSQTPPAQPVSATKSSDPVSELRNQDEAFSLLIEAFRQIQGRVIQNDYEARIKAANNLPVLKDRRHVIALANQERDLRVSKLYHQIGNLNLTYDQTRADDIRVANIDTDVPVHIDTGHAAHTLMDYVFVAPAGKDASGALKTKTVPASNYLLDKLPPLVE